MSRAEIFIEKYKELEQLIRAEYNLKPSESLDSAIDEDNRLNPYKVDLRLLRDIRNLLQHQKEIKGKYVVEPEEEVLELENNLIQSFKNKKKCFESCIRTSNICSRNINNAIKDAIKEMRNKSFTHIPIVNNNVVIGIFDENSIFNYLADEKIICIDENTTFKDIEKYLDLNPRTTEEYKFISRNYTVEQLKQDIEEAKKKGKRLDIAFITQNGKKNEKLLGLITIWDIINL